MSRTTRTASRSLAVLAVSVATLAAGHGPTTAVSAAPVPPTSATSYDAHDGPAAHAAPTAADGYVVDPRVQPEGDPRRARADARELRGPSQLPGRPADVMGLHSDPTAQRTIYLDFNGAYVAGTQWEQTGLTDGTIGAWDPAGDGAALSGAEADKVYQAWARVAEDYAPFRVDVTTQYPGKDAIERDGTADKRFGTAVVVTTDQRPMNEIDSCAGDCGGVAFYNAFAEPEQHSFMQPAFVLMPEYDDRDAGVYAAEAISHEVGHQLGLKHDGRSGDDEEEYYWGRNPWAPIMGGSYNQPVSQWSRGGYTGANNPQDDLRTMAAKGLPRRTDDVGATAATATPYAGRRLSGAITTATDVDLFRLDGCSGAVSVKVDVAAYGANLDVGSTFSDARLVERGYHDDPVRKLGIGRATGLGVSYREELPAGLGTYYVSVDGIGKAGTTAANGYDDYGSLGRYSITVYGCGRS